MSSMSSGGACCLRQRKKLAVSRHPTDAVKTTNERRFETKAERIGTVVHAYVVSE